MEIIGGAEGNLYLRHVVLIHERKTKNLQTLLFE